MIKIYDNLVPKEKLKEIENVLTYNHPWYFSTDVTSQHKTGKENLTLGTIRHLENFIDVDEYLLYLLNQKFDTSKIFRCFSNCFRKHDKTNYHVDPGNITYMFYLNSTWKQIWGAPTLFKAKNNIFPIKVFPKPGRLVVFSAKLSHKGTSPSFMFPSNIAGRFSIAFHEKL
jgi:hypothetical protein